MNHWNTVEFLPEEGREVFGFFPEDESHTSSVFTMTYGYNTSERMLVPVPTWNKRKVLASNDYVREFKVLRKWPTNWVEMPETGDIMNSDWSKIETAPTNGDEVIGLFYKEYHGMNPTIYGPFTMSFIGGEWVPTWDGSMVVEYTSYKSMDLPPTHWMHKPKPPTEE